MSECFTDDEMKIVQAALAFAMHTHVAEVRDSHGGPPRSSVEEDYDVDGWELMRLAVKLGVEYKPFDYGIGEIPERKA